LRRHAARFAEMEARHVRPLHHRTRPHTCLQPRRPTAPERANALRFRAPAATLLKTATLEFLDTG
jgi:hypothetical protein